MSPSHDNSPQVAHWIEAARRGDADALDSLVNLCRPYLLRVAELQVESDDKGKVRASDLTQESILEAQRRFTDFRGTTETELLAWLQRILINNLDRHRDHHLQSTPHPDPPPQGVREKSGCPPAQAAKGEQAPLSDLDAQGGRLGEPPTLVGRDENAVDHATLVEGQENAQTQLGSVPQELGPFHVTRALGSGSFGVVYLAEDTRLGRLVAVKVPRAEAIVTPQLRESFLREARAAARLHHTNIVQVFDVGEAGAICYIVSAYCRGGTLAVWLQGRSAPVPFRLAAHLTALLADGVQHAHDRGILHRDLKPGNVLLQTEAGPSVENEGFGYTPLISDFGVAKIIEEAAEISPLPGQKTGNSADKSGGLSPPTSAGAGTPQYMAPEQAAECWEAIGRPTDVYALGSILYQVLAGRPPFVGRTADILRQVREDEPVPPRRLRPGLPRDLEVICLKCLRKEPGERYSNARDLAEDLRLWLAGQPVRVRPVGPFQRMAKWMRRRPAAAGLIALSILAAFSVLAGTVWYAAARTREELHQRRISYATKIPEAQRTLQGGNFNSLTELLNGLRPPLGGPDLRGFEWYYLWRKYSEAGIWLDGHKNDVTGIAFSPSGDTLASAGWDGTLRLWDPDTAQPRATILAHAGLIFDIAYSPDGSSLAMVNDDKTISIWEMPMPRLKTILPRSNDTGTAVTFSPKGDTLATSGGGAAVLLWDLAGGRIRTRLEHSENANGIAFMPDGKTLVSAEASGALRLWDVTTGAEKTKTPARSHRICWSVASSPDGRLLASGGEDNDISLWDAGSLVVRAALTGPGGPVKFLAFSQDGQELVAGAVGTQGKSKIAVQVWNVAAALRRLPQKPRPTATFDVPNTDLRGLALAPDDRMLALASNDGLIRLWRPVRVSEPPVPPMSHAPEEAWAVNFSPDGTLLASAGDNEKGPKCLKVWDPATGKLRWAAAGHKALATCIAFSPDGRLLASAGYDNRIKLWDSRTGDEQATINAQLEHPRCLAFSPDGRVVASGGGLTIPSAGEERVAHLWDVATSRLLCKLGGHGKQVRGIVFSPDGRRVVTASEDRVVRIWDAESGAELRHFMDVSQVECVSYTPDGTALVWGTQIGQLTWLDLATGKARPFAGRHAGEIRSLSFTPDGRRLATGGSDGTVRLWDTITGIELLTLPAGSLPINSVAFSPSGDRLASASHDGAVKVWNAPRGR